MANASKAVVYLIPTLLSEEAIDSLPPEITKAVEQCQTLFVEHERTTRRQLKKIIPTFQVDAYQWYTIAEADADLRKAFEEALDRGETIGIMSEAGCPGLADPGQGLIETAQRKDAIVKPLTGPSSIFLALMASGMNGQQFRFNGYLPIESDKRRKAIKELEQDAVKTGCTQIFIETPYRNNAMVDAILQACRPDTRLCIAIGITSATERIQTKSVSDWKRDKPDLQKIPAIFLIGPA